MEFFLRQVLIVCVIPPPTCHPPPHTHTESSLSGPGWPLPLSAGIEPP